MTNIEILKEAQAKIIANSFGKEQSVIEEYMDLKLIADLAELIVKYRKHEDHIKE